MFQDASFSAEKIAGRHGAASQSLLVELGWGIGGGLAVGAANYAAESTAAAICVWLEHLKVIKRFLPTTAPFADHPPSNLLAVGLPYIPLYAAISHNWWQFVQRSMLDFNPITVWTFVAAAMLCHDAWFFALHTVFHKVRRLYKHVHSRHHRLGASCSAFGNAYADALDIGLCFVGFHAVLYIYLYQQPVWNPFAVASLIVVEVMTNIVGHCGYELPYWLHLVVTGGVGIFPNAANSKTHYIHHLQPQFNRALYFKHWDILAGTYRDSIKLLQ